ncbi:MAG: hypothetical protein ACI9W2_004212 [Gammaproteobacteria bacterium]|jgi:hypothetical protein
MGTSDVRPMNEAGSPFHALCPTSNNLKEPERVVDSIQRECFDQVIVCNERHVRRLLKEYVGDGHSARNHLSLNKDDRRRARQNPEEPGTSLRSLS